MRHTRELMTAAEVGRTLDPPMTPAGVTAAARAGRLSVAVRTASGMRLYTRSDVERFQAARARTKAASGSHAAA